MAAAPLLGLFERADRKHSGANASADVFAGQLTHPTLVEFDSTTVPWAELNKHLAGLLQPHRGKFSQPGYFGAPIELLELEQLKPDDQGTYTCEIDVMGKPLSIQHTVSNTN